MVAEKTQYATRQTQPPVERATLSAAERSLVSARGSAWMGPSQSWWMKVLEQASRPRSLMRA